MDNIINYFCEEIRDYSVQKKNLENEISSKKFISSEISKTIEKMIASENDTDAIFRANISNKEFHNSEIRTLKNQLEENNKSILHYENCLEEVDKKLDKLNSLLQELKDMNIQVSKLLAEKSKDEEHVIEKMPDEKNPESLVDTLRNISSRMELATKLERVDPERAKMELNLARVKLMFCIDDLEKQ